MKIFSLYPLINIAEEGKWLLTVTRFETTHSVFNRTDENNSFSNSTPGHWSSRRGAEVINKLRKLLEMRHSNDIELHKEDIRKKGDQTKIGVND